MCQHAKPLSEAMRRISVLIAHQNKSSHPQKTPQHGLTRGAQTMFRQHSFLNGVQGCIISRQDEEVTRNALLLVLLTLLATLGSLLL